MLKTLEITSFKNTKKALYQFENGLTWIHGTSGSGKTTIFEAVRYALFGKNMRGGKEEFKVHLKLTDGTEIWRERGRNKLTIKKGEKIYKGEEAQKIIEKHFGDEEVWICCSYHIQNTHHAVIQKDWKNILMKIIFGEDNSSEIKKKISKKLKEKKIILEDRKKNFDWSREYKEVPKHDISEVKEKERKKYELEILKKAQEILEKYKQEYLDDFLEFYKEVGVGNAEKIINSLKIEEELTNEKIDANIQSIQEEYIKRYKEALYYSGKKKLDETLSFIDNPVFHSERVRKIFQIIKYGIQHYGVEESRRLIEIRLNPPRKIINELSLEELENLLYQLKNYKKYSEKAKELGICYENIEEEIKNMEKKYYVCPVCNTNLTLVNEKLEKCDKKVEKSYDKKKLNELKKIPVIKLNEYLDERIIQENILFVRSKKWIVDVDQSYLSEFLELFNIFSSDLSRIEYLEVWKKFLNIDTENYKKLVEIYKKIDINKIENYENLKVWRRYMKENFRCIDEVRKVIWPNIKEIVRAKEDMKYMNKNVSELEEELKRIEVIEQEIEQYEWNLKWKEIKDLSRDVESLEKILYFAKEVEVEMINEAISLFNSLVGIMMKQIFPECRIVFNMNEDVIIDYRCNSFNSLSGGEKDRVSLAILWALHKIKGTSFILLDECLSSLDNESKKRCIHALKDLDDVQVLCVLHDIQEDLKELFDHEIDLDK